MSLHFNVRPSHSHRRKFLVTGNTGPHSRGREGRLKLPVPPLMSGVNEGGGRGHGMGVADELWVQKLSLVGHDLRGLLAVQHGEVGGHVDKDTGVGGETAGRLGPHEGRGHGAGGGGRD